MLGPGLHITIGVPYAGQSWRSELLAVGPFSPFAIISIILADLEDAAKNDHVTYNHIELWTHHEENLKGFFVGDTTSLPSDGWTKLADL